MLFSHNPIATVDGGGADPAPSVTVANFTSDNDNDISFSDGGEDYLLFGYANESSTPASSANYGGAGMTQIGSNTVEGVQSIQAWYLGSLASGSGTITASGGSGADCCAGITVDGVTGTPIQAAASTNPGSSETSISCTFTPSGAGFVICWLTLGDNATITDLKRGGVAKTLGTQWTNTSVTLEGVFGWEAIPSGLGSITYTFNFPASRRPCMMATFIPTS